MKYLLSLIIILCRCLPAYTQDEVKYLQKDSIVATELLKSCMTECKTKDNCLMYFARKLKSIPYVARTLEGGECERLVVNLRQLDCTTYVENVIALYLCIKNEKTTFRDFCNYLRNIRYENGIVTYPTRLHYFSYWIEQNEHNDIVREIVPQDSSVTENSEYDIYYMSSNPEKYPALKKDTSLIDEIAKMEKYFDGKTYRYIPKAKLKNPESLQSYIKDGDIIAIVTNKKGLDISHIGFAAWHKGNLHLLNASSIHKKVVEEPMSLYKYMMRHPSQTGIRIIRVL
jgi:hypothetical protein